MFDFPPLQDHRGHRRHRFMESSDINAAFDLLYRGMRRQVQRGLHVRGQLFALEADTQIPGQLTGSVRLLPGDLDSGSAEDWADATRRPRLFEQLLDSAQPAALYAYAVEQRSPHDVPVVWVELAEADGCHVASFPLCTGRGWAERDLLEGPHQRLLPVTQD